MRSLSRFCLLALVAWYCAASAGLVHCQTKPVKVIPPGTIAGKVTIKDKPAAGVIVALRKSDFMVESELPPRGVTDQEGNYRITNINPGTYDVFPSAPAYVVSGSAGRSKNIILTEGENVEKIDFTLIKGGVITGKVLDADGGPVIAQTVYLFRESVSTQQPQRPANLQATSTGTTDDRGIYRIFGIAAGNYKVGVGRGDTGFSTSIMPGRASFKQIFHPDVEDSAKAKVVEVSEGSESSNIDINLGRALQTYAASGRVVEGQSGNPIGRIRFGLQRLRGERMEFVANLVEVNARGEFVAEGLIPGKYSVFSMPEPGTEHFAEPVTFEIFDQDVTGIVVKMNKGSSITGVVVLENDNKAVASQLSGLQMAAWVRPQGDSVAGGTQTITGGSYSIPSPIGPDGSFRVTGLAAGLATLYLNTPTGEGRTKGFHVSRLERDGVVQTGGLQVRSDEQVSGVRVIVAFGTGTLRGTVRLTKGTLPEGAIFMVRMNRANEQVSTQVPVRVDTRGQFLIENVVPGLYDVVGMVSIPSVGVRTGAKQQVTIQDGVATEINLPVDIGTTQP